MDSWKSFRVDDPPDDVCTGFRNIYNFFHTPGTSKIYSMSYGRLKNNTAVSIFQNGNFEFVLVEIHDVLI